MIGNLPEQTPTLGTILKFFLLLVSSSSFVAYCASECCELRIEACGCGFMRRSDRLKFWKTNWRWIRRWWILKMVEQLRELRSSICGSERDWENFCRLWTLKVVNWSWAMIPGEDDWWVKRMIYRGGSKLTEIKLCYLQCEEVVICFISVSQGVREIS